jgi:hypothetical protein
MIVSIHQPAYLPWLGYFDRISASDVFVFLDNVQFEKNSFTNRNRIKTSTGALWLTIPVLGGGHLSKTLVDIKIDWTQNWKRKHLEAIKQNYMRAAFFSDRFERLVTSYTLEAESLADFCYRQLQFWLDRLAISTPIVRASELGVVGSKSRLIADICKNLGATTYLSGPFGRDYLEEAYFAAAGVAIRYHDYSPPVYPQLFGEFIPALSVVDYWLNAAPQDASLIDFRTG